MNNEIKEIYFSNLEWTKTHDNMGGVMGNIIFKNNMSYEEYNKLFKSCYFILCNKDYITNLQTENEKLKNELEQQNIETGLEIERLNKEIGILKLNSQHLVKYNDELENIIKELEKWLKDYIKLFDKPDMLEEQTLEVLKEVLDKLQELKGDSSNECN